MRDALDDPALAGSVAPLEDDHDLLAGMLHPVLQLHQLGLQTQQLMEIGVPVDGRLVLLRGDEGEILGDEKIVDLHFQFFVQAVCPFRFNPGFCTFFGHQSVPLKYIPEVRPGSSAHSTGRRMPKDCEQVIHEGF